MRSLIQWIIIAALSFPLLFVFLFKGEMETYSLPPLHRLFLQDSLGLDPFSLKNQIKKAFTDIRNMRGYGCITDKVLNSVIKITALKGTLKIYTDLSVDYQSVHPLRVRARILRRFGK